MKEYKVLVAIIPRGERDFVRRLFIVNANDIDSAKALAEKTATKEGLNVLKYRSMVIGEK